MADGSEEDDTGGEEESECEDGSSHGGFPQLEYQCAPGRMTPEQILPGKKPSDPSPIHPTRSGKSFLHYHKAFSPPRPLIRKEELNCIIYE